jgi:hypothetical protein
MLYDKRWDAKVEQKADPFKLETLIAWLEYQPADKEYCYTDNGYCLLGQYFSAAGYKNVQVYSNLVFYHGCAKSRVEYPYSFNRIANGMDDRADWKYVRTFGGALKRAIDWKNGKEC